MSLDSKYTNLEFNDIGNYNFRI